jgi:pimeloyl-ACP methyl ester carboxylesterase
MDETAIRSLEIRVGALTFEVDVAGAAGRPLVLLLHGFPHSSHSFRRELPALAHAGYLAIAPNQRGYSPNARPLSRADYATRALLDDALALAGAFGGERFHLVGHDWGGQLAWLLASSEPRKVASLCVLSRPHPRAFARALKADPAQSERSRHHRAYDDPNTAARLLADDARGLRKTLRACGVAPDVAEVYVARLAQPGALDAALHWYRAAASGEPLRAGVIEVPTLYVWGDADANVGRAAAEATAEHVSAPYRFEVIAGGAHTLTDQPGVDVTQLIVSHVAANT